MVVCHCAAINDSAIARLRSEGATVDDIIQHAIDRLAPYARRAPKGVGNRGP
jgi:hypothetical protein